MEPPPPSSDSPSTSPSNSSSKARLHAAAILTTAGRVSLFVGGVLPWLLPLGRRYVPLGRAGIALDLVFVPMCHRLPERTLTLAGMPMPLCSRCAGVFAGVALGALVMRPLLPPARSRWLIAAAGALMALEVVTQDAGLHPIWHPTRLLTGLLFGYALAVTCVAALRGPRPPPPTPSA
jgi:uncharacterized membrane protein